MKLLLGIFILLSFSVVGICQDGLTIAKEMFVTVKTLKTVKFDFDAKTIVSLEDVEKLTPEQVDDALRGYGYDPAQVKLHGQVFMKVLFENLELKKKIAELESQLKAKNG